ncbi:hypothetical protein ACLK1T_05010 [Escherichia coli]
MKELLKRTEEEHIKGVVMPGTVVLKSWALTSRPRLTVAMCWGLSPR